MTINLKTWHIVAAGTVATIGVLTALGFMTPGERIARAEAAGRSASPEAEIRADLKDYAARITTLEANYINLQRAAERSEAKLDRILERLARR